jgi:hypothetical protein
VTPATRREEVEPLEPRADVDEVAALQGMSSTRKRWVRQLIHPLIAQLKSIEAELASTRQARDEALASLNKASHAKDIVVIEKPFGEAGDKRKGFVLIKAMGLDGSPKEREQYKAMLVSSCSHQRLSVAINMCHPRHQHVSPTTLIPSYGHMRAPSLLAPSSVPCHFFLVHNLRPVSLMTPTHLERHQGILDPYWHQQDAFVQETGPRKTRDFEHSGNVHPDAYSYCQATDTNHSSDAKQVPLPHIQAVSCILALYRNAQATSQKCEAICSEACCPGFSFKWHG